METSSRVTSPWLATSPGEAKAAHRPPRVLARHRPPRVLARCRPQRVLARCRPPRVLARCRSPRVLARQTAPRSGGTVVELAAEAAGAIMAAAAAAAEEAAMVTPFAAAQPRPHVAGRPVGKSGGGQPQVLLATDQREALARPQVLQMTGRGTAASARIAQPSYLSLLADTRRQGRGRRERESAAICPGKIGRASCRERV